MDDEGGVPLGFYPCSNPRCTGVRCSGCHVEMEREECPAHRAMCLALAQTGRGRGRARAKRKSGSRDASKSKKKRKKPRVKAGEPVRLLLVDRETGEVRLADDADGDGGQKMKKRKKDAGGADASGDKKKKKRKKKKKKRKSLYDEAHARLDERLERAAQRPNSLGMSVAESQHVLRQSLKRRELLAQLLLSSLMYAGAAKE